jgi:transcriptional regulator with XRE-family HTH domain
VTSNVAGSDEQRRIGLRVREFRRLRSLTTRELASRVGISASMVSQIENGTSAASLRTLQGLATALAVPLADLVSGDVPRAPRVAAVVRRDKRKRLQLPGSDTVFELLTPDLRWNVEFLRGELPPRDPPIAGSDEPGQECLLVLEGRARVVVGADEFVLDEGDSITFERALPHAIANVGSTPVVYLSAITPPSF